MAGTVRLTYEEMNSNCTSLKSYASEYESTAQAVLSLVDSFSGSWEGQAEATFEEDYRTLTNAMKTSTETMREITTLVESYVNSMQEIENAYGKSHVTVG
ncbi:MAG: WXG100 family type VII secretion target [Bacillota bacterium]|nr:WXG100 family type VII secretion target [Bacillota bacterium]